MLRMERTLSASKRRAAGARRNQQRGACDARRHPRGQRQAYVAERYAGIRKRVNRRISAINCSAAGRALRRETPNRFAITVSMRS